MTFAIDFATWGWPQWTEVGLMAFVLLANLTLDGETKSQSRYSAGGALVSIVLTAFILGSGGFFS